MLTSQEQITRLHQLMEGTDNDALRTLMGELALRIMLPMKDVLDHVPGETLKAKADRIGVSRTTMYVWLNERHRPKGPLAKKLARITGLPILGIMAMEERRDVGRKVAAKAEKLASRGEAAPGGDGRTKRRFRRILAPQGGSRSVRARHKRTRGGLVGAERSAP